VSKKAVIQPKYKIKHLLLRLWGHLRLRRRIEFGLLLFLMVLASFAEIISIGAILPFLAVLTNPQQIFELQAAEPFLKFLRIQNEHELLLSLTLFFVISALLSGMIRILLAWGSTRVTFGAGADISIDIYRRTLYQPYSVHVARNSSEVINGIITKTNSVIYGAISPTLTLISSVVMLVAILGILISIEPIISLATFSGFGFIYLIIIRFTRARKIRNSFEIAHESTQVVKSLQEGLGGIRDVLIDRAQATYCKIYQEADYPLRRAQGNNLFIGLAPRYGIEALGMALIAIIAYFVAQQPSGLANAIPLLGMLALGAQRLLPVMQQAYQSWSSIVGSQSSLEDTLDLLDQPLPSYYEKSVIDTLPFNKVISLSKISFRYSLNTPWVLRDVSLNIERGKRIGFIGVTGSGKSTLLDIIMGLLEPSEGSFEIDRKVISNQNNRAWQARIAHVPQAIYLSDSSIEENIAFGIPKEEIDFERVVLAARQAQIAETIQSWPSGYQTLVGERGVRLSGGQRQRIGIARALYKNADVLIFDEATSALDSDTEQAVMDAIQTLSFDVTILIIAHRLTTLKDCDQIVELDGGQIIRVGTYDDIVTQVFNRR
jgi:ATP-binding cassette subfamily B protein